MPEISSGHIILAPIRFSVADWRRERHNWFKRFLTIVGFYCTDRQVCCIGPTVIKTQALIFQLNWKHNSFKFPRIGPSLQWRGWKLMQPSCNIYHSPSSSHGIKMFGKCFFLIPHIDIFRRCSMSFLAKIFRKYHDFPPWIFSLFALRALIPHFAQKLISPFQ